MVLLIREICNAIIFRARDYIPSENILQFIKNREDIKQVCDKL